jgi:hypothetical protein
MDVSRSQSWQISEAADGAICAKFIGPTPTDEVAPFLTALVAIMPESNARLVFDLRELGGYNSETKEPMKAWLLTHKLAIQELTVLVPKSGAMLKMVVAAMALATGVKIRVREDLEALASFAAP